MYWRPAPKDEPPAEELSWALKKAIAQRLWGHDGSLYGDEITVDSHILSYLDGLIDAGMSDASELRDAIVKHGRVVIWIGE